MRSANLGLSLASLLLCVQAVYAEGEQSTDAEDKALSAHASLSASTPLAIPGKKAVELLAQTITLSDPKAAVLILATVQLVYASVPTSKLVEIAVARDQQAIETVSVQIGSAPRAVSEIPITVHAWDYPGNGPHTYSVIAKSSDNGVKATARRLTVIEIP